MRARLSEAGFTLIELLVVMLILGILSVITLSYLGSSAGISKSRHAASTGDREACAVSAASIETAAFAYYVGHDQTWPPDIATLATTTPPYIKSLPKARWGLVYDNTTGKVDATGCDKL
jgi:prepilin-type N-terminal cleavage/methylation domain-containing protein